MAGLFDNEEQVKNYAHARPTYPSWWFSRLASLTPRHDLAWDVGTGNGQAAVPVAEYYDRVIGTDVSEKQLQFAEKRPNVRYAVTPTALTEDAVDSIVGREDSVDLVTVATAVHWFDLDVFYSRVKRVLRKEGGVIAVWTYSLPRVTPAVDDAFFQLQQCSMPYRDPRAHYAFDEYKTLPFPFHGVLEGGSGVEGRPEKFEMEKEMGLNDFLGLFRSSSFVATAKAKGANILKGDVLQRLEEAWGGAHVRRTVTFPCFALVGALKPKHERLPLPLQGSTHP